MTFVPAGLILILCLSATTGHAQESASLSSDIRKLDTELFDAFNACDLERMGKIFAEDLEFFHDTGGLTDYRQTMAASKANCDKGLGLRRELVESSHEVYAIPRYGAIQKGKHTFCHEENGQDDCGTFEFVHVWRREGDRWRLARVISYGH
jgi:ketosteroid isomerase-like protein